MRLVKFVLKVLVLPLMLILYTVQILGTMASNIVSFLLGLVMLLGLIAGSFLAFQRNWVGVAVMFGFEFVCVAVQLAVLFLPALAGEWAKNLEVFLHS